MLAVHNLTKQFGRLLALDAVSFEVEGAAIHGLIGPNGSGKTTAFNVITGFLSPTAGKVTWEGKDITNHSPYQISRLGIARTFQNTSNYSNLTVRENLVMASRNHISTGSLSRLLHLRPARAEEAEHCRVADALLERFAMHEFADVAAAELPGGTQKVLGVAIAVSTGARLLMLDEPLAGLNSGEKVRLTAILRGIRDEGLSLLLIEHDMKAIMQACDRVTVLCNGNLLADGTPDQVREDAATIQAYLGEESG